MTPDIINSVNASLVAMRIVSGVRRDPKGIKRLKPAEQLPINGLRVCSCERLVEVVMGVNQTRQYNVAAAIEC